MLECCVTRKNVSNFNLKLEEIFRSLRSPRTASIAPKTAIQPKRTRACFDSRTIHMNQQAAHNAMTYLNNFQTFRPPRFTQRTMMKDEQQRLKQKQRPEMIEHLCKH